MQEFADFKTSRMSNFWVGIGLLVIPASVFYLAFYGTEDQFLQTRARRGGSLIKLIEQTIGWDIFVVLMMAFGIWAFIYAVVSMWKVFDSTPDVRAHLDRMEFHPVVRRLPAEYEDISHWSIEIVSGHPVVWVHFHEAYWSLQGLFKRKTIKMEGSKEELEPLVSYFSRHSIMREKFVSS